MKSHAPFCVVLLLLSAACATNRDGFVSERINACKEGQKITLRADIVQASHASDRIPSRLDVAVEVANNSDDAIEVDYVRVEPMPMDRDSIYEISGGQVSDDRTIAPGEAAIFEVPMTALYRPRTTAEPRLSGSLLDSSVVVGLKDEQVFRCRFQFRF